MKKKTENKKKIDFYLLFFIPLVEALGENVGKGEKKCLSEAFSPFPGVFFSKDFI